MQLSCITIRGMQTLQSILTRLKQQGYRHTQIRGAVIDSLVSRPQPISVAELLRLLSKKKIYANKTTVYRELAFLKERGIINEIKLGDSLKRYEIASETHHHHLVCVTCEKVEDVVLRKDLLAEEHRIQRTRLFKILSHSLEFYGICARCSVTS